MISEEHSMKLVLDAINRLEAKHDSLHKKLEETALSAAKFETIFNERVPADRIAGIESNIARLDKESTEMRTKVTPIWVAGGVLLSTMIHWFTDLIGRGSH